VDHTRRELTLLTMLSAVLCGVAFMCDEPVAALVFAALTIGSIVIASRVGGGSPT
jgi:hypothetical protein